MKKRDNDELRHSMRSVLSNYRPYTRQFYLITSDFAIPDTTPNLSIPDTWRLGQVPQWLDMNGNRDWRDGDVELNIIHHAEIFRPYYGNSFNRYARTVLLFSYFYLHFRCRYQLSVSTLVMLSNHNLHTFLICRNTCKRHTTCQ